MKKDIHIEKLKIIIIKLESHIKVALAQSQESINRVATLTGEELAAIEQQIKAIGYNNPFIIADDNINSDIAQVITHVDRQVSR